MNIQRCSPRQVAGLHDRVSSFGLHGLSGLGSPGGSSPAVGSQVNMPRVNMPPVQLLNRPRPNVQVYEIPSGTKGTIATLKLMKKLVMGPWGGRNPDVVFLARDIVQHVGSKDYRQEANAIFEYVKAHVRYRLDPMAMEWIQTPLYTLQTAQGDCDDMSSLICALAVAAGHRAAFVTVAGDPSRPNSYSHVYAMIGVTTNGKTEWLAADATQNNATLGWEPPAEKVFKKTIWVLDPNIAVEDKQWR
jgi:transglutaminase superfamily protein